MQVFKITRNPFGWYMQVYIITRNPFCFSSIENSDCNKLINMPKEKTKHSNSCLSNPAYNGWLSKKIKQLQGVPIFVKILIYQT